MRASGEDKKVMQLLRQIEELEAQVTQRGLVVTLGDSLFAAGMPDLKANAAVDLNKLIAFLEDYPARTIVIEGRSDSPGERGYNRSLSMRRAGAVKSFLIAHGLSASRVTELGDARDPVANNQSRGSGERDRNVEVIIVNPVSILS